jgi:recombination protein RecA
MSTQTSTDPARDKALEGALDAIQKRNGPGAIMRFGDGTPTDIAAIPTGSMAIDEALGCGGYPRGRVVEIFGPESSGKTTLTLHAIAECQRQGGVCAFIDAEHALDVGYARNLGVDLDQLLIAQPDSGEQALEITETLVRSGAVDLVVVDSVAALVPRAELEGEMGDAHVGLQARLMSQALRKITGVTGRTGTCVIFINQLRQKIGVTWGSGETTTGGNALKFYCSLRLDIRRIGSVKAGAREDNAHIGNKTRVRVVKNKLAPPFQQAIVEIMYGRGICPAGELLDRAESEGIVQRKGAWYTLGDDKLGQGKERARDKLLEDTELFERLASLVHAPAVAK